MAKAKAKKVIEPTRVLPDELLNMIRILLAHKIYFTLANPTHSRMALHVIKQDFERTRELFPHLYPKRVNFEYGYTVYFDLYGAPDKSEKLQV